MDRDQRDRFLATAYQVKPWWAPMWEVQVLSGLRPGETYTLSEGDFDLDPKHATARIVRTLADDGQDVEEEDTPKGNRGRTIYLSARAGRSSSNASRSRRSRSCGGAGGRGRPRSSAQRSAPTPTRATSVEPSPRVIKAAKLPHFTPHGLRHTYASLLLVAGLDVYYVSRMLGNASIQESVDTYGRWLPANRPGVLDALDSEPPVTAVL